MVGLTALVATMCVTACDTLRPSPTENEVRAQVAEVQPASVADTLAVTYLCGDIFRVRNPRTEEELIRWSLNNTQPRATLRAGARHEGQTFRDTYVDAGGVGAFWYLTRFKLESVAHGGLPACTPPTPPIPISSDNLPSLGPLDTLLTSDPSEPGVMVYRRQATVYFHGAATATQIDAFFRQFRARAFYGRTYNAGSPTIEFGVQFPDNGSDYAVLRSTIDAMRAFSGVRTAAPRKIGSQSIKPASYPA
jgi:hypothetical protein